MPDSQPKQVRLSMELESEKVILGCIICDAKFMEKAKVLRPESFLYNSHKIIFEALLKLYETDKDLDFHLLIRDLQQQGKLQEITDGQAYIASLFDYFHLYHVAFDKHVDLVNKAAHARSWQHAGEKMIASVADDVGTLEDSLAEMEERIKLIRHGIKQSNPNIKIGDMIDKQLDRVEDRAIKGVRSVGISTGFKDLDRVLAGLAPGNVYLLAARPSMGKSSLATQLIYNAAIMGSPSILFSLEMTKEALFDKIVCQNGFINTHNYRIGYLTKPEYNSLIDMAAKLRDLPLFINDKSSLKTSEIKDYISICKDAADIKLIAIDYVQRLKPNYANKPRIEQVQQLSSDCKELAVHFNCPLILLSQLSRAPEARPDHRPMLQDLRETGDLEQDADVVIFLYREDYYRKRKAKAGQDVELDHICEVNVAKQREGPVDTIKLYFTEHYTRFDNIGDEKHEQSNMF